MHVQHNFNVGIEGSNGRNKLREVVDMDDVALLLPQVDGYAQRVGQVVKPRVEIAK